ncbi:unnamed protein product [Knipowitschia caucasica]
MADPNFYFMYKGMYMPRVFYSPEGLKYWEEFSFQPDDVIVSTYPKSGTNWALELVPLVLSGGQPGLVASVPTWERTVNMGDKNIFHTDLEAWPSPHVFATHFRYDMMPKSFYSVKPKVINVMRNPKDILISAHHYYTKAHFHSTPGPLTKFLHQFLQGDVSYGSWFDHVKGWLNAEDKSHILYLTYEEMTQDLQKVVRRVGEFLEKRLDDEAVDKIAEMCCFQSMKENNTKRDHGKKDQAKIPVIDHSTFYRKGITGDWKNHLSEEQAQQFDSVFEEKMKNVDFRFFP